MLEYHHVHCSRLDDEDRMSTLGIQHHRMSFIVLTAFMLQMLQDMVPVQKVSIDAVVLGKKGTEFKSVNDYSEQ